MKDTQFSSGWEFVIFLLISIVAGLLPCFYFANLWGHIMVPLGLPALGLFTVAAMQSLFNLVRPSPRNTIVANTDKLEKGEQNPWAALVNVHFMYLCIFGFGHLYLWLSTM